MILRINNKQQPIDFYVCYIQSKIGVVSFLTKGEEKVDWEIK